jgi:protein gp37
MDKSRAADAKGSTTWGHKGAAIRKVTTMENSKIQWTDHTFNPWIGCAKVHAGCTHCYAEELMATRYGRVEWGKDGTRARTKTWGDPIRWDRAAAAAGVRAKVFCASLADVFELRAELAPWRADLFRLIDRTPNLDWLLLTKRPENVASMWHSLTYVDESGNEWGESKPTAVRFKRENVWLGTSPCNQETADKAIPSLLESRDLAKVLFLSAEPLIGPVDLSAYLPSFRDPQRSFVDWVIVGGESGHGARPCAKEWVRSLVNQCEAAGVACFVKQLGLQPTIGGIGCDLGSKKGDDPAKWPADLRVREFPPLAMV